MSTNEELYRSASGRTVVTTADVFVNGTTIPISHVSGVSTVKISPERSRALLGTGLGVLLIIFGMFSVWSFLAGIVVAALGGWYVHVLRPRHGLNLITPAGEGTYATCYERQPIADARAAIEMALARYENGKHVAIERAPESHRYDQLLRLDQLREKGILTDAEFRAEKQRLLSLPD